MSTSRTTTSTTPAPITRSAWYAETHRHDRRCWWDLTQARWVCAGQR